MAAVALNILIMIALSSVPLSKIPEGRVCWASMLTGVGSCGAWIPLDQAIRSRDEANFEYSPPIEFWVETKDGECPNGSDCT